MEQKQLDEIDESYFGEEFIDEDSEKQAETEEKKSKKIKKTAKAKTEKKEVVDEITITPVKDEEPKPIETAPTVDPWAEMEEEQSSGSGAWKTLTGILVVLLIASIFTNGFDFSGSPTGAVVVEGISLAEAEQAALLFVNTNLLQAPFVATVESSSDEGSLFKVTLSVAGQTVDSYLTKDGKLFFPQGFDTAADVVEEAELTPLIVEEVVVEEEPAVEKTTEEPEPVVEEVEVEEPVVEEVVVTGAVKAVQLSSKKWSFSPETVTVNKGDIVKFTIVPDSSNAAFALNEYTFAVEEFGVSEEVSGETVVEFTADKAGEFAFICGSCEAWRGMTGTLVVE